MLALHDFAATLRFATIHDLDLGAFASGITTRRGNCISFHQDRNCSARPSHAPWGGDLSTIAADQLVEACDFCSRRFASRNGWEDLLYAAEVLALAYADPATVKACRLAAARLGEVYQSAGLVPRTWVADFGDDFTLDPAAEVVPSMVRVRELMRDLPAQAGKHRDARTASRCVRAGLAPSEQASSYVRVATRHPVTGMVPMKGFAAAVFAEGDAALRTDSCWVVRVPRDLAAAVAPTTTDSPEVLPVPAEASPAEVAEACRVYDPADTSVTFEEILTAVRGA